MDHNTTDKEQDKIISDKFKTLDQQRGRNKKVTSTNNCVIPKE